MCVAEMKLVHRKKRCKTASIVVNMQSSFIICVTESTGNVYWRSQY